ncbi:uncharacterized protein LOC112898052 [Panicum hallii]|uniref:uncharacterized protein LOC112898052 n=1 Tax=Panicum hallii TaxID=206008 RepID=UPI000DF4E438|nr:uncharacterized protein LOC112898052 [Panicum hallii]
MGLDISDMLTPSKALFYRIFPRNTAVSLGKVVLTVTSRTRTEYIKFEVANFETPYHAILGRPALAKSMAVLHYMYLLFKMPGPNGMLPFRGDLRKSYDCNQETIEYASTTQVPDSAAEVLAASKQLFQSEMDILAKKLSQSKVKPTSNVGIKTIELEEGNSSKIAPIGSGLDAKYESTLVNFL